MANENVDVEVLAPVIGYSTPPVGNRQASRALVYGLLGFIPFVPGILAIRTARRGLADVDTDPHLGGRGKARAALTLGVVSVVIWAVVTLTLPSAFMKARRAAMESQCASQLRQIGAATIMYAASHRGFVPGSADDLISSGLAPLSLWVCPAAKGDASKPPASSGAWGSYSYVYLAAGQRLSMIPAPATTPLAYEPLTNHGDGRVDVLFFDGHVEFMRRAGFQTLLASLAATLPATGTVPAPTTGPAAATQPIGPPPGPP